VLFLRATDRIQTKERRKTGPTEKTAGVLKGAGVFGNKQVVGVQERNEQAIGLFQEWRPGEQDGL
jgi:hypothetical protein